MPALKKAKSPPREIIRVSSYSLESINGRYIEVLQALRENQCSMENAFRLTGCPRSTIRDFVATAELKIVDSREHDLVVCDQLGSVKEHEAVCRKRLPRHLPVMAISLEKSMTNNNDDL